MIFCSNCGKGIPAESKFCTFCGAPIPLGDKDQLSPTPPNIQTSPLSVSKPYTASKGKNEFYKNIGFWGAIILLAGFFLPLYNSFINLSFFDMVIDPNVDPAVYLYLVFPVAAVVVILQGVTRILPGVISNIFKVLPILLLILIVVVELNKTGQILNFTDFSQFTEVAGFGLYATLLGSILILFFRKSK